MEKALRLGLATALLCAASPALASDFSGIGRAFWWAVLALLALIVLVVSLFRRRRHLGTREADAVVAGFAALTLAPGVLIHVDDRWLPMPLPGLGIAMLEGDAGVLFPVPFLSMMLCWGLLFLLFERLRARHDAGEDSQP
ncbi:MAG: hypothetical protein KAF27_10290 [Porphyrobacter sp.]|nr:hypothetical protein [Porphyrobacter sp.]